MSIKAVQRTGASRFPQRQIEHHRRLGPVADLCVRRAEDESRCGYSCYREWTAPACSTPHCSCPVPLLYLQASEDRIVWPRCGRLVQAERSDAEIPELPGPHLLLQAVPSDAAAVLASFCERVAAQ